MFQKLKPLRIDCLKFYNFRYYGSSQPHSPNTKIGIHSKTSQADKFDDYFVNNDRYKVFRKDSVILHQFDDETHNLTEWHRPKSTNIHQWNNLPNTATNDELIQAFEEMISYSISHDINLTDPMFDCFVDEFTESVEQFTTNELVRAIQLFARASLDKNLVLQRNYIELYIALDQAISMTAVNLLPGQIIFLSSVWKYIPLAKKTHFSVLLGRLFNRYFRHMSAQELSQATDFMNLMNKPIDDIPAFEMILEQRMNNMNLKELSTILRTFSRVETIIQKFELKSKLYSYLEKQDLSQLDDKFLIHILNTITEFPATSEEQLQQLKKIMKNLKKTLENRSIRLCLLIASMGTPIRIFDTGTVEYFFQRCLIQSNELADLSIYDFDLLTRLINNYPVHSNIQKKIGYQIIDQIKGRLDCVAHQGFHKALIQTIRNLIVRGIYDPDLVDNLLRPDYIKFIYKTRKQLDGALYEIDGYTRINLKNVYHGNRLDDMYLEKFKHLGTYIPDQVKRYKQSEAFTYKVETQIKEIFQHWQYAHAISHHRHADNFVCINKETLESVDVSDRYPPLYTGKSFEASQLTGNDPNLIVFAFISGNIQNININNEKSNSCENDSFSYLELKMQQLKILGFYPILIPVREGDLRKFIISKINEQLNSLGIDRKLQQILLNK